MFSVSVHLPIIYIYQVFVIFKFNIRCVFNNYLQQISDSLHSSVTFNHICVRLIRPIEKGHDTILWNVIVCVVVWWMTYSTIDEIRFINCCSF